MTVTRNTAYNLHWPQRLRLIFVHRVSISTLPIIFPSGLHFFSFRFSLFFFKIWDTWGQKKNPVGSNLVSLNDWPQWECVQDAPEVLSPPCRVTPGRFHLTCTHDEMSNASRGPSPTARPHTWPRQPPVFCLLFQFLARAGATHAEGMYFTLLDVRVCKSEIWHTLTGFRQEEMLGITSGVALKDSARPKTYLWLWQAFISDVIHCSVEKIQKLRPQQAQCFCFHLTRRAEGNSCQVRWWPCSSL